MKPRDRAYGPAWTRHPLAVLGCLLLAAVALAAVALADRASAKSPAPAASTPLAHVAIASALEEDEEEADEEELEGEGAEEDEEEAEAENNQPGLPAGVPEECLDYTVAARIVIVPARDTLRLKVSYDSLDSGRAGLRYWVNGPKGTAKLGGAHWQLSRWGHLERLRRLNDKLASEVSAARSFTVRVEIPGTPSYCRAYSTRHLTRRHWTGGRAVWSEREAGTPPLR